MAGRAAVRSANKNQAALDTTMPEGELQGYPLMLTGTALDYRVRLFFEPEFNFEGTEALSRMSEGTAVFPGCENTAWTLWNSGLALTPEQRKDDDYLGRLCIIAAHLEGVSRSGIDGEWIVKAETMTHDQLLQSLPNFWINDISLSPNPPKGWHLGSCMRD